MKKLLQQNKKHFTGLAAMILLGIIALSFSDTPLLPLPQGYAQVQTDTVPDKQLTMKEYDELSKTLDVELKRVAESIKNIDLEKIAKDVEGTLKEINLQEINLEVEKALKSVNLAEIETEVSKALAEVNCDKINTEVKQALQEAKAEIEKIDWNEIQQQVKDAGKEVEKAKAELKNMDMKKVMAEAKQGVDKAKNELRQLRTMFTEMEKDGLIDTKKGFKIEYKDNELFINGEKQSDAVKDKYRQYFKDGNFKITIAKEEKEAF